MNDQPEALRVADLMAQRVKPIWISAGFKPDRECVAAARLLREQHEEIERLKAERNGFYMDYRVKCDEKTKAQAMEIERLRAALAAPKQEPVAFGYLWPTGRHPEFRFTQQKRDGVDGMPIYTAPPAAAPDETEALRRDAERYRYLRNRDPKQVSRRSGKAAGVWIDWKDDLSGLQLLTGDDADAAIDAAMETKP